MSRRWYSVRPAFLWAALSMLWTTVYGSCLVFNGNLIGVGVLAASPVFGVLIYSALREALPQQGPPPDEKSP